MVDGTSENMTVGVVGGGIDLGIDVNYLVITR